MRIRSAALAALLLLAAAPVQAQGPSAPGPDGKVPLGGRPEQREPFPPIRDWHSLRITLNRTGCFGTCPAYTVEIDGDGRVLYQGERDVRAVGRRLARIGAGDVRLLYAAFRQADFFALRDSYRVPETDLPVYTVAIAYDGRSKSIVDYAGVMLGMPHAVIDLENLIDKTAHTQRWIGRRGARRG